MIKNYLKIAFRNLLKNPVYSFINIFGLAVGIACCLLILFYVQNEWSYDSFHTNSDQLYRAWVHEDYGDDEIYFSAITPVILAQTLENHIPEVEMVTRRFVFTNLVKLPDQTEAFSELVTMVDPAILDMFDFQLLEGNPETIFNNPGSVVLTEYMAGQFFGEQNPLQEVISIRIGDTFENFTVTGIIQDPPTNSSIQYDFLIPFSNVARFYSENAQTSWFNVSVETYVKLHDQANAELIEPKLVSMMQTVLGDLYGDDFTESGLIYTVGLQPITDIRLNTDIPEGIAAVSDPVYSYILAAIAFLILLIASVNFMTLSISRSSSRAKEVGIRKSIGASRHQLMYQYWGEALLLTALAFGIGLVLAEILLPHFNLLSGTELSLNYSGYSLLFWGIAVIFISLLSGIYPALVLSGFRPVDVLKGRLNLSADKNYFRQSMVVFQFTLTIALVAATLVISNQLDYMRSTDLGYEKEQIVVLETGLSTGPQISLIEILEEANRVKSRVQSEAGGITGIEQIGMSAYTPVQIQSAGTRDELRGYEGDAARIYYDVFDWMIRANRDSFHFEHRSRRPPRDPVNALLSFVYTLLTSDCVAAAETVGLDPQVGFLHTVRPGRPALALDLMEELRPVIADRLVLSLINRRQIQPKDLTVRPGGSVRMTDDARRTVLTAYQRRKQEEIRHSVLDQDVPLGLLAHAQARLLARHLRKDIDSYLPYLLR